MEGPLPGVMNKGLGAAGPTEGTKNSSALHPASGRVGTPSSSHHAPHARYLTMAQAIGGLGSQLGW